MGSNSDLDRRVQALERGFNLLLEKTKVERYIYLTTNLVLFVCIVAFLLVALASFYKNGLPGEATLLLQFFIGGSGGGVAALVTWRTMKIWDQYFSTLEKILAPGDTGRHWPLQTGKNNTQ